MNIMNIDVDLVFTYVDGYDPEFIKMKNSYLNSLNKKYNPDIRSKGLDEIIYSVNSVIKFIPWIRKIFIVTNNQIPPIDKQLISSGKVVIIDQNTIVDSKYLPTFNSDVIESYLHNIPNLSEIFLYNNDDMMHLNHIHRRDIYEVRNNKVLLKIRNNYNKNSRVHQVEYSLRIDYTKKLFLNIDPNIRLINNHHTKFLRKSSMKYIEEKFKKLLDKMRINRVRGTGYIQYLFFLLNVDNILHNNIILNYGRDVIEKKLGNKEGNRLLFNDVLQIRPKFVCFNSMNPSFKEIFPQVMNEIL
jgi:hypothetical protein